VGEDKGRWTGRRIRVGGRGGGYEEKGGWRRQGEEFSTGEVVRGGG